MSRTPRSEIFAEDEIGVYHCINRCVRQLHLLRDDQPNSRIVPPRREWIRARLEELAGIFAIDHLNFSILENHFHVLIRNRPDIRDGWSDEDVVRRWWRLYPRRRDKDGRPAEMTCDELNAMLADTAHVQIWRRRLGHISWFMKCLDEYIAVRANREDGTKGRFWEGRFKSVRILDECGLLACAMYIDLNPIRARLAETPETSYFTSVFVRIQAMRAGAESPTADEAMNVSSTSVTSTASFDALKKPMEPAAEGMAALNDSSMDRIICAPESPAGWLSPVKLDPQHEVDAPSPTRRASNRGYLDTPFVEYLDLMDWTGREVRADKPGSIPMHLAPIFARLRIQGEVWVEMIRNFSRWFPTAVGRIENMKREAQRRGRQFLHGAARCRAAFREGPEVVIATQ